GAWEDRAVRPRRGRGTCVADTGATFDGQQDRRDGRSGNLARGAGGGGSVRRSRGAAAAMRLLGAPMLSAVGPPALMAASPSAAPEASASPSASAAMPAGQDQPPERSGEN